MLKRAWLSLEERATKNVKNPQTGCATDFVIHIFCVALICGMCTLRPDVMLFYACTGICASRRPFSIVQHSALEAKLAHDTSSSSVISFNRNMKTSARFMTVWLAMLNAKCV